MPRLLARCDAPVERLACGALHTLLVLRGGSLWAFGEGTRGGLGLGVERQVAAAPTRVATEEAAEGVRVVFVGVAAGGGHSVALAADGAVFTWGVGGWVQLPVLFVARDSHPAQS